MNNDANEQTLCGPNHRADSIEDVAMIYWLPASEEPAADNMTDTSSFTSSSSLQAPTPIRLRVDDELTDELQQSAANILQLQPGEAALCFPANFRAPACLASPSNMKPPTPVRRKFISCPSGNEYSDHVHNYRYAERTYFEGGHSSSKSKW
eukprot:6175215-Pleurochrysis_carterae.AAC.7